MLLYVIGLCVVILKVAVGLGFVIFVHELGHFAVAKLCGVKCEKFYLGFDIAGLKLCKFRWGETEYGVGILPLGGYVKMLGQEDNPARLREEMERARKAEGGGRKAEGSKERETRNAELSGPPSALRPPPSPNSQSPIPHPSPFDPRSFLAKSVPQRMAIISAGVVMNVIFAFLMAVVAFGIGVEQTPCVIGAIFPGEPAWQSDLRVGDDILEIAGKKMTQFRDLQTSISLGDIDPEKGVPLLVSRPGVKEPFTITVKPDSSRGVFFIGVASGKIARLMEDRKTWLVQKRPPVFPGSPAAQAKPPFHNGDRIVQIDDVPIHDYAQIDAELARKADRKITVVVSRNEDAQGKSALSIAVDRNPMRTLGLVMKMGEITAIQADSPAAAGIKAGDVLLKIDGRDLPDPMALPDQLNRRAGQKIELTIQRKASKTPEVVRARLREPIGFSPPEIDDSPLAVSSLGIAYRVLNVVERVVEGSPAAKAGMLSGDVVTKATLIPPDKETLRALDLDESEASIPLSQKQRYWWPAFIHGLQTRLPGGSVKLSFFRKEAGKENERTATLKPVDAEGWYNVDRGFLFEPMTFARKVESVGDAFALGSQETLDEMTIVFRSMKKLGTGQVSAGNLIGPVGLVKIALRYADQGTAALLIFLTLLSANLAVINFLPIPVLDGGHFVLLAYEGIRRRPANEHVQVVLTYIGLALILALMVWTLGLDFGLIPRR